MKHNGHRSEIVGAEKIKGTVMLGEPFRGMHQHAGEQPREMWCIAVSAADLSTLAATIKGLSEFIYETETLETDMVHHHCHARIWLSVDDISAVNEAHGYMALNILRLSPQRWAHYQEQYEQNKLTES